MAGEGEGEDLEIPVTLIGYQAGRHNGFALQFDYKAYLRLFEGMYPRQIAQVFTIWAQMSGVRNELYLDMKPSSEGYHILMILCERDDAQGIVGILRSLDKADFMRALKLAKKRRRERYSLFD